MLNTETVRLDDVLFTVVGAVIPPGEDHPLWRCGVSLERATWTEAEETQEIAYAHLTKPGTLGVLAEYDEAGNFWGVLGVFEIWGDWLCPGWAPEHVHFKPLGPKTSQRIIDQAENKDTFQAFIHKLNAAELFTMAIAVKPDGAAEA